MLEDALITGSTLAMRVLGAEIDHADAVELWTTAQVTHRRLRTARRKNLRSDAESTPAAANAPVE